MDMYRCSVQNILRRMCFLKFFDFQGQSLILSDTASQKCLHLGHYQRFLFHLCKIHRRKKKSVSNVCREMIIMIRMINVCGEQLALSVLDT